ncbi:MAG: YdiL family protein [Oscillospiraceae bacterium]|nr:YdiL family protein [Oscillospiraceae bacterium]
MSKKRLRSKTLSAEPHVIVVNDLECQAMFSRGKNQRIGDTYLRSIEKSALVATRVRGAGRINEKYHNGLNVFNVADKANASHILTPIIPKNRLAWKNEQEEAQPIPQEVQAQLRETAKISNKMEVKPYKKVHEALQESVDKSTERMMQDLNESFSK